MHEVPRQPKARRRLLQSLDPQRDHELIAHIVAVWEFPWDMTRSLELALFRTFCDPSVSRLLARTGEFVERAQKRYDDTDLLISELLENGYSSLRGGAALRRINQQHGRFSIPGDDMLYVLSTFVLEPVRWIDRFGWRRLGAVERLGLFHFWQQVGERMGIAGIPSEYAALEQLNREHERVRFCYRDSNRRVAAATMTMFASWFPRPARPVVDAAMRSLMDPPLLEGFGLAPPSRVTRAVVLGGLRARAIGLRLWPGRRRPRRRTQRPNRTYPHGYAIERLGPAMAEAAGSPRAGDDRR